MKSYSWFAILRELWLVSLLKYLLFTLYWLISYIYLHILDPRIIILGHLYITGKYDFSPEIGIFGCNKQGSDFLHLPNMCIVWTVLWCTNGLSYYYWLVYYRMYRNKCHTCPNQLCSTSYRTFFRHQSDFKMSIYQTIISSILASYFKFQNRSKSKTMKIYPNIR